MRSFFAVALLLPSVLGAAFHPRVAPPSVAPSVRLDEGEIIGSTKETVSQFLGIPYAQSTGGKNRFRLPKPVGRYHSRINATVFGPACPQQISDNPPPPPGLFAGFPPSLAPLIPGEVGNTSEDCLSLNVYRPANVKAGERLPVVAWIYGGGFETGASSVYDGSIIVNRSIAIDQPVVFVSMNYRLSAWGFLGGQEVKEAGVGNLGLEDQRTALRWIQRYISHFGGDPSKVTIWGESAGAYSVSMHMLTNGGNTEGLFHGGFMQSGAPGSIGDITGYQPIYDSLVNSTGCSGVADTLDCLRNVPEDKFQASVNLIPNFNSNLSVNLAFLPSVDGRFLKNNPQKLVLEGSVARIPFITGNNDDEGTLFTPATLSTNDATLSYIRDNFLFGANQSTMDAIAKLYPSDPAAGSPFDTGSQNAFTPEFKRLAALIGDYQFHGPRRRLINARAHKQPVWSFLNKRLKNIENLGSFHGSDLLQTIFGHAELQDYFISFINHYDPNKATSAATKNESLIYWPRFSEEKRELLTILDGDVPLNITKDDFREEAINFLNDFVIDHPLHPRLSI